MAANFKDAVVTAAESNVKLAHYRDWVAKQKERQRRWTRGPVGRLKVGTAALYKRFIIEGLLRQKPLPPSVDGRHIPLSPGLVRRKPLTDERRGRPYVSNFIRSSRYTVWDFFPKQLFFQFSKLANFYFLLIGIMQMIPGLSTTGTYTTIGPLMAFVALSMGKEGYDDYRRYKLDKQENRSEVWVLDPEATVRSSSKRRGGFLKGLRKTEKNNVDDEMTELEGIGAATEEVSWSKVQWQDVRVGDIVRLRRDQNLPADIVLLHATGPNGVAYIETMALDGETNLKSKQACPLFAGRCATPAGMAACDATVVSEDPNLDLYNYEGRVTVNGETLPLTINQVVYRGSTLRNTDEAIGLVINSGEECKIRMNATKNVQAKAPAMQNIVNRIVVLLVIFVVLLSFGCTIGNEVWKRQYAPRAWYLQKVQVPFKQIIVGFIIAFNTLIPLSLYVSLEIIKIGQLLLMQDVDMYDPVSDTPMVANTTTILENLGQVSYVFSDKTGTLTENVMRFRKMSVAGTAWLHDMDLQREADEKERKRRLTDRRMAKGKAMHSTEASATKTSLSQDDAEAVERPLIAGQHHGQNQPQRGGSISHWKSSVRPAHAQPELKTEDLIAYIRRKPHTPFSRKARHFILCIALCHTCLPEISEKGDITFQAASPDELALVDAAKDLGYLVIDRPAQSIKLQFRDFDGSEITESYEVLDVIEFSSKRKRMSIIIRMPDGRTCIFTKGADSSILPRLKLNNLAAQKASAVERRATQRKSVEQEKALRRRSTQMTNRDSLKLGRAAQRMSLRKGSVKRSTSLVRRTSLVTDEVDLWLNRRETEELDEQPGNAEAYQLPRGSFARGRSLDYTSPVDDPYDGLVDESLATNDGAIFERCFQHIDDFASEGLRTLLFAYRYLEDDEYKKWKTIYHDATTSLDNRQERVEAAAELIEQGFDLAGATAIEDKLQQGVPDTIDKLRRANIKVWMLTGDKRETAINIAQSARICKPFSEVYILDATRGKLQEKIASALIDVGRGMIPHSVVVIDGHTLSVVEEDESIKILFFDLAARVDSVICCRASPSQKATLVKCIRDRVPSSMTLAIGDGANDIAMIQASHVGIGISGKEGLQAARIADYSIAQFRFLQRLLFVHGRWNYIRTGKYILGTFWKEIVFYLVQAQYQRYNGYTGTSLYESASLSVFNTLFTSLPVILLGIFEQDLSAETLLAVPELYAYGQKNLGFNFRKYLLSMAMATAEAVIIYYAIYGIYNSSLFTIDTTLYAMGTLAFTVCVVFINIKMLVLELHNQTIVSFLGLIISIAGWFIWNIFLSAIYAPRVGPYVVRGAFLKNFGRNPTWWLTGLMTLAAVIVFELLAASVRRVFWPRDQDLMQELEKDAGIMEVMKEHAAERGEAGESDGPQEAKGSLPPKPAHASSIDTPASPGLAEMAYGWNGSGSGPSAATANERGGRQSVAEESMPPPFTPPAQERANPMDPPASGNAARRSSAEPQRSASWLVEMSGANGQDQANPYFVQSPVDLRMPSIDERRQG
ncbi:phospholipid-translocating P-type ATPase [Coniochaeta ligniaria NRRL 30616]|uniref:Phospholipid-transporting ATPase n=1 Tax=Coniochaeta ligniaria NRRL 30616 TaxID=1408157 RepID=A0A1J7ISM4_9PEZI|nr:phospholipid-translocating P-type ATPase [Coniochaeta ligniaria NRRL 30616]